uniref:Uncharacterized protein n=1 Tax=Anguilla anguilla TaxID=7936 RepID=A0A0E9PGF6_ANGAN
MAGAAVSRAAHWVGKKGKALNTTFSQLPMQAIQVSYKYCSCIITLNSRNYYYFLKKADQINRSQEL